MSALRHISNWTEEERYLQSIEVDDSDSLWFQPPEMPAGSSTPPWPHVPIG
jgi:hypothetical protein